MRQLDKLPEIQVECQVNPFIITEEEKKENYELLIERSIEYVGGGYRRNELKNLEMAQADFEHQLYLEKKKQINDEYHLVVNGASQWCQEGFLTAKAELPNYCTQESFDEKGLSPNEIREKEQNLQEARNNCIIQGTEELLQQKEKKLAEYLENINKFRDSAIEECDRKIREAWERYEKSQKESQVDDKNL